MKLSPSILRRRRASGAMSGANIATRKAILRQNVGQKEVATKVEDPGRSRRKMATRVMLHPQQINCPT